MRDAVEECAPLGWDGGRRGDFLFWGEEIGQVRAQFLFCVCATLVDGTGTVVHLARGAVELNPLWAAFIEQAGALSAMGVRMAVGLALLAVLFAFRRHSLARAGFMVVVAAFIPLTLYHVFLFIYLPLVS